LVRLRVPFDVAFSIDPDTRMAWLSILVEMDTGHAWDWTTSRWVEKKR
jgi:hypothetical protein